MAGLKAMWVVFRSFASGLSCYSRALTSVDSVLTAYKDGAACHTDWK